MMRMPRTNGSDPSAPNRCVRCGSASLAFTRSYYTPEWVCLLCDSDERALPTFERAREAELTAVKGGEWNFPGIGLSRDDWKILMQRLKERG